MTWRVHSFVMWWPQDTHTFVHTHTHTLAQAFVHALVHARDRTHTLAHAGHFKLFTLSAWHLISLIRARRDLNADHKKCRIWQKKKRKQNGNKKNENGQSKKGKQNKRQQRWKRAASTSELKLLQLLSRCYFYCCCCCCRCTLQLHSRKKSVRSEYRRAKSEKVNKRKWGVKIVGQHWLLCSVSSTL